MTREKIIQGFRAIKEAIKALEQEPCEDCLYKQRSSKKHITKAKIC